MKKTILIASLLLSGCATQLSKKSDFDQTNKNGLVVIGVQSLSGSYSLSFAKLDPETCKLSNSLGLGNKSFADNLFDTPIKRDYIIDTFSPGIWVVNYSSFETGYNSRTTVYYNSGTVAFNVNPGEFIHIGKLVISTSNAAISEPDPENLKKFLMEYPNIQVEPTTVKPWITAFGKDSKTTRIGCNPAPKNLALNQTN